MHLHKTHPIVIPIFYAELSIAPTIPRCEPSCARLVYEYCLVINHYAERVVYIDNLYNIIYIMLYCI